MTPGELLDMQRRLYEYLGRPDEETLQFYDNLYDVLSSAYHDPEMAGFARSTWVAWFYPADHGRDIFQLMRSPLYAAPAYQVTPSIVDAVTGMYRKTAAEQPIRFEPGELPSPTGFMWLEKKVTLMDIGGDMQPIQAFSWGPVYVPSSSSESMAGEGIRFTAWCSPEDKGHALKSLPGSPLLLNSSQVTPFSREMRRIDMQLRDGKLVKVSKSETPDDLLLWAQVLWLFMRTEIVSLAAGQVQRPFRRRAERAGINTDVKVVLLRRMRQGEHEVTHRTVDWTCQWVVQEFWRHLDSYAGRHESHRAKVAGADKHCEVCGGRVTHVRTHVRGPEGLPLKAVPETVYRVSR